MNKKSILIIGGGISGLSVLHFLKKKYAEHPSVEIKLFEKNIELGGNAKTAYDQDALFEYGPNGFVDSKEATLTLIRDLGLEPELITANPQAKRRFIMVNNSLHAIPTGLIDLLRFRPLSWIDKLRLPFEIFVKPGDNPDESVYEFGVRRFGENVSRVFLDAMITGIYAGDAKKINMKLAFPTIHEIEQRYGSVIKEFLHLRKTKNNIFSPGRLTSLKKGLRQLTDALYRQYHASITLSQEVESIERSEEHFLVHIQNRVYEADEIVLCTPAPAAAQITRNLNSTLSQQLNLVPYAPVVVVGLVYAREQFKNIPEGYGYLIPSSQNKQVLGVLFESFIFEGRAAANHITMRVMMGGALHSEVLRLKEKDLIALAHEEIRRTLKTSHIRQPEKTFLAIWPKAIPQYSTEYVPIKMTIEREIAKMPRFHIVANYFSGVGLNDCIANAQIVANQSKF